VKEAEIARAFEPVDAIKEAFRKNAVIYDNIWMYFTKKAVEIVRYCKKKNIDILGLEAFRLSGFGIQPSLNNSTWFKDTKGNWDDAVNFILDTENEEFLYEIWYQGY